jgi:hypothetical protein
MGDDMSKSDRKLIEAWMTDVAIRMMRLAARSGR